MPKRDNTVQHRTITCQWCKHDYLAPKCHTSTKARDTCPNWLYLQQPAKPAKKGKSK